jgi:dipeptidyl aminopeptidase/acylaminoacyl peptidase
MILDIHGGPHTLYGNGFDFRYQDFTANGYVVLMVNPRGSTGYGAAFADAIDQSFPGNLDAGDLLSGVDAAVATGAIDSERLFVMGCSGGGSLTAWLIAHTDRFRAAAVLCPVSDWISFAGTTDVAAFGYSRFAKPFWEDPQPWLDHSPLQHVGSVNTPTLVMVGDRDFRTPVGQAEQYYSALRQRGVPTRLVIIKGETHQPWRGAPSNLIRTQLYLRTWFARYGGEDVVQP